jgi:Yip1 domain
MDGFSRIVGVFFEPSKTFADIAQRPAWIVPMILTILVALAFSVAVSQRIGWDRVIRHQFETNSRLQQLPQDQKDQAIAMQVKIASVSGYAAPLVFVPLADVIMAAVLLGIAGGIMSGGMRFKQVFAVVCYGGLPAVISGILKVVVIFLKNPEDIAIENALPFFNLGAFMDPNTPSKALYAFATSMDLFTIWSILLMATGLKAAAGKRLSFAGALGSVVVPWLLFVLATSALAKLR